MLLSFFSGWVLLVEHSTHLRRLIEMKVDICYNIGKIGNNNYVVKQITLNFLRIRNGKNYHAGQMSPM